MAKLTKKEYYRRKRRHEKIQRIRMAIKLTVYVLFAVLVSSAVWVVAKPLVSKVGEEKETVDQQTSAEAETDLDLSVDEQLLPEEELPITEPEILEPEEEPQVTDVPEEEQEDDALEEPEEESSEEDTQEDVLDVAVEEEYVLLENPVGGTVTGWKADNTGWWYVKEDGTKYSNEWQTIDGVEYYFDKEGFMSTGWVDVEGKERFFRIDGTEDKEAHQKLVALTYDDGPSEKTKRLLDILEQYDVPATFFVVGTQCEAYPDVLKREAELGMEIGSHTYNHEYLHKSTADEIKKTMNKNEEVITSIIGYGSKHMRPTGGGMNDTVRDTIEFPMILWDVDTLDWDSRNADSVVDITLSQVKDGSIILMHDLYESTVDASERIIPELIERGYRLVTISELAKRRGVTLKDAEAYYDFYPQHE